ncbi:MAG: 50S ribosomal protein L11 methyltransferase [Proteobacteria bacterium]|nr:MAG: 50S ribosomal protein L11 methyltransferase [Pseudomonadota bacterium]
MTWQQIICHTSLAHEEAVSELLENAGAASVTLEDAADQAVLEPLPGETPLWDELVITGLYPLDADLTALMIWLETQKQALGIRQLKWEKLQDRPWVREWMDNFHPMCFGERLWVYPSWHEVAVPDHAAIKILLDPGLAFGTGTHPTTALCLEWLDAEPLQGKSVLDYGCGSGILAIAAAKLGAANITVTDIDPQALEATQENARRNQLNLDSIKVCLPEALPAQQYDIVLANILAGPLIQLADSILAQLKPSGRLALSGILAEQGEMVKTAYATHLKDMVITQKEDWLRISGTHR